MITEKENIRVRERRRAPRVRCDFAIEIETLKGSITGRAMNISTSGMYLECDSHISLFREIAIGIKLPGIEELIECTGVVVRCDKDPEKQVYNIAIFFHDIEPEDKEQLYRYVEKKLAG